VDRGEMPIELGDSWFSPKCLSGQPRVINREGRALDGLGGFPLTNPNQTPNLAISTTRE
jgi:hypothetical protein